VRLTRVLGALGGALLTTAVAHAATHVVLVQSDLAPVTAAERLQMQQLCAELAADGYDVRVAHEADAGAPVVIRAVPSTSGLSVAVTMRPGGAERAQTTNVSVSGDDAEAARTLALKTAEWLRASGIEPSAAASGGSGRGALRLGLSLGLLQHSGGFPSAFAQGISLRDGLGAVSLDARGWLSSRELLSAPGGTASVEQALLLGGASFAPAFRDGWAPFVGVVAGGYHLEGEGHAVPGLRSQRVGRWFFAAGPSAGLRVQAFEGARVGLEFYAGVDALWVVPRPVVRFVSQPVAFAGQPLLVISSGLELVFR